jgi:hypothetical protein
MNRSTLAALVGLLAAACSSSPTQPTPPRPAVPLAAGATALVATAGAALPLVGPAGVDLARCLQSSGDTACFSGARPVGRVATAGAVAPGAPGALTATSNGSSVTLTWSAPASGDPVVTYVIEAGSASGLANLANFATASTATTFSTSGVPNGTYYVRIRAQNTAGTSAASNEATLVVGGSACASAPNAPSGLTSTVSGSTVTLAWTAPSGGCAPTTYGIEAGSASGKSDLAIVLTGNTSTSFVANGVSAGTYYVRVRAGNGSTVGSVSNEVIVTVGSTTTGGSLTGTWTGFSPDGFVWNASSGNCDLEHDMQLTLTQTGAALSGSLYDSVRKAARSACSSSVGVITGPYTVTGTAGAGTLTLSATIMGQTLVFSGTFTNTRMALSGAGGLATLTLNRQ